MLYVDIKLRTKSSGSSLVELSVVLVILGLLAGGVLSGQALIRAAGLRSVVTEYERYISATQTFRDKYFALPGDMTNDQAFWDIADVTPSVCVTTASTDKKTCNGNGNGKIDGNAAGSNEVFRFWQHLANAGLIEGTYDGIAHGASSTHASTAENSPKGKLSNGYWHIAGWGIQSGNPSRFAMDYGNTLSIGGILTDNWPATPLFKPPELWNIDKKIDDGRPGYGSLVAYRWGTCTTATSETELSADYKLDNDSSMECAPQFRNVF